jgi:sulfotransferase family protein
MIMPEHFSSGKDAFRGSARLKPMETSNPETIWLPSASVAGSARSLESDRAIERRTRPVFVMGCHRSGTNLLYDTLLSAGGFAVYRGYLPVYKMLIPRFGSLTKLDNRKRMMAAWVRSKGFRRSALDAERLTLRVLNECRSGGDFIRIVMSEIALSQNVARWVVYDPDNLLYIPSIKADIPEALFIHMIRDGRDVALSLSKMGGFKPFIWAREAKGLLPTAVYWEWMVREGRQYGLRTPADYLEVRYEDLVSDPRATLEKLEEFLDHDLDYGHIQKENLGRLRESNSSFSGESIQQSPVNRWRNKFSNHEVDAIEKMVGEYLEELGYPLSSPGTARTSGLREKFTRAFYFNLLNAKLWLKTRTPAGRLANLETLELSDSVEPTGAE